MPVNRPFWPPGPCRGPRRIDRCNRRYNRNDTTPQLKVADQGVRGMIRCRCIDNW